MKYKFKQLKLSSEEKLWLTELLKADFSQVDVRALKVKLRKKLPKGFTPDTIDRRLIRDDHLTLIGLWHVDPNSPRFAHVSNVIEVTRDLILKQPGISSMEPKEIANLAGITERDAGIALGLISELGGFFGSTSRSGGDYGLTSAGFGQGDSGYDKFLYFEDLAREMEQFFIGPLAGRVRNKRPTETAKQQHGPVSCKQKSSRDTWNDIRNEFGISKQGLGKKMNFVTDKHKKNIIFRDIEHAYILAKNEFPKPAVILAGGVIEELLRLYLHSERIRPERNTFNGYIKACKDHDVLKSVINNLLDVARQFRNLVHLEKEKSPEDAIAPATAIIIVAAIFEIVKDF